MPNPDRQFWPYHPRTTIYATILILVSLFLVFLALRTFVKWPSENSEIAVLTGILLFSLVPIFLCLLDVIMVRGGKIGLGALNVDFSTLPQSVMPGFTVPVNIGVPDQTVSDSTTTMILDALDQATSSNIVVIDLKEGKAWWETRLLVLLAGAVRLRRPEIVVFIGKDKGIEGYFQGYGFCSDLLQNLLEIDPQYKLSYYKALAAGRQWELVEPSGPGKIPDKPGWMESGLATRHTWMAFDNATGLPKKFFFEQSLASDLGVQIESTGQKREISLIRLEEIFRTVLRKECMDVNWQTERKNEVFFSSDSAYIAVSQNGRYSHMVSRFTMLNAIVRSMVERK